MPHPRWDRILACVGTIKYPNLGSLKNSFGTPGKSSPAIFAFCSPEFPLRSYPEKCSLLEVGTFSLHGGAGNRRKPSRTQ